MRPGSSFREAAGEVLTVILFRRVLIDSKEADSPCLPTHSLVAAFIVTGHREEENEEIGVVAKGGGHQSFFLSLLCLWSRSSTLCVSWCLSSVVFLGVCFPSGFTCKDRPLWRESFHPLPKRIPALLEILSNISWQARPAISALPAMPVSVLPGGAMGAPGTGGCFSPFLLTPSE